MALATSVFRGLLTFGFLVTTLTQEDGFTFSLLRLSPEDTSSGLLYGVATLARISSIRAQRARS